MQARNILFAATQPPYSSVNNITRPLSGLLAIYNKIFRILQHHHKICIYMKHIFLMTHLIGPRTAKITIINERVTRFNLL